MRILIPSSRMKWDLCQWNGSKIEQLESSMMIHIAMDCPTGTELIKILMPVIFGHKNELKPKKTKSNLDL